MDTMWLEDLLALSETLNFSRAAEKRNITQPAFGRRIKALEAWCGAELVDRSTHRLRLTSAGDAVLAASRDIQDRLERLRQELEQADSAASTVTFAATHALSFVFFPRWIQALGTATMPIRLLSDNMNACERIMQEGRAQFLLCHFSTESELRLDGQRFRHIELSTDQLVPVSAPDARGAPQHSLPGSPEAPVPHLAFEEKSGMGRILKARLADRQSGLSLNTVFTSHLAMTLKALALDGKGVAWVPKSLVEAELAQGTLVVAGEETLAVEVQIVLIRQRQRMSEMGEAFWELARTNAHGAAPLASQALPQPRPVSD